jgi:hypothetical protein
MRSRTRSLRAKSRPRAICEAPTLMLRRSLTVNLPRAACKGYCACASSELVTLNRLVPHLVWRRAVAKSC